MFPSINSQQRSSKSGKSSKKVPLKPGHSLVDWIRLTKSGVDLKGTGSRMLQISAEELSKHNKPNDIWICLRGLVYNVSKYVEYHPGGADELMRGAGKDATSLFQEVHGWVNYESMLKECLIGRYTGMRTVKPKPKQSLMPPASTSVTNLDPLGRNSVPVDSDYSKMGLKINLQDYSQPSVPLSVPSNMDVYMDWHQSPTELVLVLHSNNKNIRKNQIICDITDNLLVDIDYFSMHKIINFHIHLKDKVDNAISVNLATNGMVEIALKKYNPRAWETIGVITKTEKASSDLAIHKLRYIQCEITEKKFVTHDTSLYHIKLPPSRFMCIPPGFHIYLQTLVEGVAVCKPYTAVLPSMTEREADSMYSSSDTICLMIKHYPNGALTPIIDRLSIGNHMLVSTYDGNLDLSVTDQFHDFVFLAAGTGITPMIRVLHYLIHKSESSHSKLLFFNKTSEDIIWRNEFEKLQQDYSGEFSFEAVLSEADDQWTGKQGRISRNLIENYLKQMGIQDNNVFFFICGPVLFTKLALDILQQLNYSNLHAFT